VATRKTPSSAKADAPDGPRAGRPISPGPDYGIPSGAKGLLPWAHATERLAAAHHYWISTVGPGGRPHVTPVDGVWLDDRLYFGGSPSTRRTRNLADNPAVAIHVGDGSDVVIVHGQAEPLGAAAHDLAVRLSEAVQAKYGYGPRPQDYEAAANGNFVVKPRLVFAWKAFPNDVTRWRLA
jgi:nitroimidazol reductase NimA-like FMN-containing flavoprotein (pyridoxamine 5'-phosphate oxidase superfamily)